MENCLLKELQYRTSRSSGPGGQHVNKTESRVELLWKPAESSCLDDSQKSLLMARLRHRISDEGYLKLSSQKYRSQTRNREEVTGRFLRLVEGSIKPVKERRPTRPSRASVEKRLESKKQRGQLKRGRRKDFES